MYTFTVNKEEFTKIITGLTATKLSIMEAIRNQKIMHLSTDDVIAYNKEIEAIDALKEKLLFKPAQNLMS